MPLVLTIAWRNIFRHRGKTLIIGGILFFGTLIMTLGNGVIAGMDRALRVNIVDSFTGHLVLISNEQKVDSVLMSGSTQTAETFRNFDKIKQALHQVPYIKSFLPGGIGYVWVLNDLGHPMDTYLLGVDFVRYNHFFSNSITAQEGRLLKDGERGTLLPIKIREMLYDFSTVWFYPKDSFLDRTKFTAQALAEGNRLLTRQQIVFMGLSRKNSSLDIRSDVRGIVRFRSLNSVLGMYAITDMESFRECMGFRTDQQKQAEPSPVQKTILSLDDKSLDSLFSVDGIAALTEKANSVIPVAPRAPSVSSHASQGVYNLVYLKLRPGTDLKKAKSELNKLFLSKGLGARAVTWSEAIGMLGQMSAIMKGALFLLVSMIFFVAIIIIMNKLSMTAMERITEIGMMRAVGGRRSFVSLMFLMETFLLSAAFGGAGVGIGSLVVAFLARLRLTSTNEMLQIFFGGEVFSPTITLDTLWTCILQLVVVTVLSVIYPVWVARKIRPLDAVSRD